MASHRIRAVDLFCGAGGLTHGLRSAGIDVTLGVDVDPACAYPLTANNDTSFDGRSVVALSGEDMLKAWGDADVTLLAGCAPCQPFSTYSQSWSSPEDERWDLLSHFARLVRESAPDLVTMENVPKLKKVDVFDRFIEGLKRGGYHVSFQVIKCSEFGIPQKRQRLVLLASKYGPISFVEPTTPQGCELTVRSAIGELEVIGAGKQSGKDPLHQSANLSALNMKRMKFSTPGGSWRDWPAKLRADCHLKTTGKSYPSVYGRMSWDEPSPTITTQYFAFGSGRFGHPDQDRALSLREGSLLQSFPADYKFVPPGQPIFKATIGRLIGNAVPVKLGEAIGRSLVIHVEKYPSEKHAA